MPDYDLGTARGTIELDASSLGRAQAAFATLGAAMLGFGAVAVGGFALVVREAAEFERVMSAVRAVSGATDEQMQALSQTALDLGSNTIFAATDIGRAMEQLAKAGLTVEEILGGAAEATITLAAAAGDELAGGVDSAAVVIANAMRTFSAGADELDHFADVIVGAAASSTISVDDMATSMTYAGPIAASLGFSIDDLSTALAILGDRGIRGSTAGTSLRGVLLSLTGASGPAREAMRDLGLLTEDGSNAFFDMQGNLKPLPEIMQILQDATRGLSEEQRAAAFNAIFQRRAMNAAMILADQGAAGFDAYASAIAGIDAGDVAATKLDNLSGDMQLLKNNVNALVIGVGLHFQDMLRGWVQGLDGVVDWLRTLNPELLAQIVGFTAIAGAIIGVLGAISLMIALGLRMYRQFVVLAEGIHLVFGMMRLLTATLLTNPWFLLVAALVALGLAMYHAYQNSEEFRTAINNAFESVRSFVMPIIDIVVAGIQALVEAFQRGPGKGTGFIGFMEDIGVAARAVFDFFANDFLPGITAFFAALAGGGVTSDGFVGAMERIGVALRAAFFFVKDVAIPTIVDLARAVGSFLVDAFHRAQDVVEFITEEIFPRIGFVVEEAVERAVSAFQWFEDNVLPIFGAVAALIGATTELIIDKIQQIINLVRVLGPVWQVGWNAIVLLIQSVFNILRGVFQVGINFLQNLWQLFGDNLFEAARLVWDYIRGIIEGALGVIRGVIDVVTGLIKGDWDRVWNGIVSILEGVWTTITTIVETAIEGLKLVIETALDAIVLIWRTIWDTVTTVLRTAWTNMANAVRTGVDTVLGFIRGLPGLILGLLSSLPGLLSTHGAQLLYGLWNSAKNFWDHILWPFFRNLPGAILDAVGNIAGRFYNLGRSIIEGLWNGWFSLKDWLWNKITGFVGGLLDDIKGFFGIGSPSKLMAEEVGAPMAAGIAKGFLDGLALVKRAAAQITPTIQTQVKPIALGTSLVGAATAPTTTNITFDFTNAQFGEGGVEEVRQTLSSSDVLDKILMAAKAGRR